MSSTNTPAIQAFSALSRLKDDIVSAQNAGNGDFTLFMDRLWEIIGHVADETVAEEVLKLSASARLQESFMPLWADHIAQRNGSTAAAFSRQRRVLLEIAYEQYPADYALKELALAGESAKGGLAVIGCGAFPETVMHGYKTGRFSTVVGVDGKPGTIDMAKRIFEWLMKHSGMACSFVAAEGKDYDFSRAGVIVVANGIRDKLSVLARACATMPEHAVILARQPVRLGKLVYEDIFSDGTPQGLKILGKVNASPLSCTYAFGKAKQA